LIGHYYDYCRTLTMRTIVEILVVDDSDEDAALTLDCLRRAAPDMTVLRLTDGGQALHFIRATDGYASRPPGLPKLVILDLHMPGMGGVAVLESLRESPGMQEMPVVLWTSSSNPVFAEQARQAGAAEYRVKPQTLDAYRAEIESIVQRWLQNDAIEPRDRAQRDRLEA
jgi:Response regulator containing CheY-like receiver, AAA-type ATPase, and DNA-binding domains